MLLGPFKYHQAGRGLVPNLHTSKTFFWLPGPHGPPNPYGAQWVDGAHGADMMVYYLASIPPLAV